MTLDYRKLKEEFKKKDEYFRRLKVIKSKKFENEKEDSEAFCEEKNQKQLYWEYCIGK